MTVYMFASDPEYSQIDELQTMLCLAHNPHTLRCWAPQDMAEPELKALLATLTAAQGDLLQAAMFDGPTPECFVAFINELLSAGNCCT